MTTPMAHDDSQLWGWMTEPLMEAGHTHERAEHISRQLVAWVRRDRDPDSTTYAPGDAQPDPLPQRVADCDGDVYDHQDTDPGQYQKIEASRARYGEPDDDGLLTWDELMDGLGPLTVL